MTIEGRLSYGMGHRGGRGLEGWREEDERGEEEREEEEREEGRRGVDMDVGRARLESLFSR